MKWILLLTLISCGAHNQPEALDLADSDGDQILNYLEEDELAKYIANIEPIGKVSGVIRFVHEKQVELSFSNHLNLDAESMRLLVAREGDHLKEDYFSEWRKLRIHKSENLNSLKLKQYSVNIHFQTNNAQIDEVYIVHEKSMTKVSKWSAYMKVELSASVLEALARGEAHLLVKKDMKKGKFYSEEIEQTISKRTNRVFLFKQDGAHVLYVSKDLPLQDFLNQFGIQEIKKISESDLFFKSRVESSPEWYIREFENGDKVITYSTFQDVHAKFLERFNFVSKDVKRENGVPTTELSLTSHLDSDMYFRIRANQTLRSFEKSVQTKNYHEGGGGGRDGNGGIRWSCQHYTQKIKSEEIITPSFEDVLTNLNLQGEISKWVEGIDERGIYWEILLKPNSSNIKLRLPQKSEESYTTTGEYQVSCSKGQAPKRNSAALKTNIEGKLSLAIESYVEKIQ